MAITQFYPPLTVGYLYTYWAPLGFVIGVSIIREAIEDFARYVLSLRRHIWVKSYYPTWGPPPQILAIRKIDFAS